MTPTVAYQPNPRQEAFHSACGPWVWYCAGYGSGKTTAGVWEAFSNAVVQHPGFEGIVAAPTYALLFQAWFTEWQRWIPREYWQLRRDPLKGPHLVIATAAGPSTIWLRSTSNPASNEGINAAWLVFDEAPRERARAAFDVLAARVRRGYPGRQRRIAILGPPMTRRHWTAEEFGAGPDGGRRGDQLEWSDGTRSVVRARTRDNPFLPAGYESTLRARPGATRAWCGQFLDALFGAMEGAVYPAFDRDVHVVPAASLEGRRWRRSVAGTDWGWEHPGAMVVCGQDALGDIYVLGEALHQHKVVDDAPDGWGPIAADLARRHLLNAFHGDPSSPGNLEALGRLLRKRGLAARTYAADNDVGEGLRRVEARLEWAVARAKGGASAARSTGKALYVSDACPQVIAQFESYARKKDRLGAITEEPMDTGDDAMDALRYAVMALAA